MEFDYGQQVEHFDEIDYFLNSTDSESDFFAKTVSISSNHSYVLIGKVLDTCELFMSLLIPCIIIKDGTMFCGSIVVAKNIFHNNINGLASKLDHLQEYLAGSSTKLDIVTITETSEKEDSGQEQGVKGTFHDI